MPFRKTGANEYKSPSGRKFTEKQVKLYYATGGFKEKLAKRSKKLGRPVGYEDLVQELVTIGTGHLNIK